MCSSPSSDPSIDPLIEVLVVDVDGTLCPVDTLRILRLRWRILHPFRWGEPRRWREISKQNEKCELWSRTGFSRGLVVNRGVLELVERCRTDGARIVVMTGSCEGLGAWAAQGLNGMVDEVHGSDAGRNLTKATKARFIVERYGDRSVMYVGDSVDDYEVWTLVRSAGVIDGTRVDVDVVRGMVDHLEIVPRPGVLRRLLVWCLLVSSRTPAAPTSS